MGVIVRPGQVLCYTAVNQSIQKDIWRENMISSFMMREDTGREDNVKYIAPTFLLLDAVGGAGVSESVGSGTISPSSRVYSPLSMVLLM